MEWSEQPDQLTVRTAIMRRGEIRAALRGLDAKLAIAAAHAGIKKPREPIACVAGIDDEARMILGNIQDQIVALEAELDTIEADININAYHKDMYKAIAYKERY